MMLSPWQRDVADNYGGGDYAHLQTLDECHDVGDGLFTFLMIELDPKEDCNSRKMALERIRSAIEELEAIEQIIEDSCCLTDGCDEDARNGEGFDGYCGNCADRREAAGVYEDEA